MDRMVPQPGSYGGLLSAADQRAAGRDARMMLASGLLSAAGPQRMPVSLGQAIGASLPPALAVRDQRAEAGVRNEMLRRQIDNENRQNASRAKFSGLLRTAGGEDGELLGLLADIDPQLAIGVMTGGRDRADPAALREMQALGFPMTQEGFAAYNAAKAQGTGGDLAAQLLIDERKARLEREKREADQTAEQREKDRETRANAIRRSLVQTEEIVEHAQNLEGTFLAAGIPAAQLRAAGMSTLAGLGAAVGLDTTEIQSQVDEFNKMKKGMADQLINLIESGGLGDPTDSKLRQYKDALANPETSLGAVKEIQGKIAIDLLGRADVEEVEIAGRERIENNIQQWRGFQPSATEPVVDAPAVVRRVADIARMSLEQLQQLDPASLTQELRDAAADRWDELHAAP